MKAIYYKPLWRNCNKKVRKLLAEQSNSKCFWCKITVKEYDLKDKENMPDDQATLDHLKSKSKGRKSYEVVPKVLACYKCNRERGRRDELNNPKQL